MEGSGTRVVDVWESREALQAFVEGRLVPAFEKAGATFLRHEAPKVCRDPLMFSSAWPYHRLAYTYLPSLLADSDGDGSEDEDKDDETQNCQQA